MSIDTTPPVTPTMTATSTRRETTPISPTIMASQVRTTALGKPSIMEKKMRSDIPFPIPCSVICSPSHITKIPPTVRVTTVLIVKTRPEVTTAPSIEPTKTE